MDEIGEANKELMSAAINFESESGAVERKKYVVHLNAKLDGTETQNSLLAQQIKLLSSEPRPDPLDLNIKKILFEQKLRKRKNKQCEQIQNESLSLMPLVFIDPIIFKNGD